LKFTLQSAQATPLIGQQLALCTYKDPDLPVDGRLNEARRILEEIGDLDTTTNQETLGLTGAVYKRLWEVSARKEYLERSLTFYQRGYEQGIASDQGYTGINAAFVLDLLAEQELPDQATDSQIPVVVAAPMQRPSAQPLSFSVGRAQFGDDDFSHGKPPGPLPRLRSACFVVGDLCTTRHLKRLQRVDIACVGLQS